MISNPNYSSCLCLFGVFCLVFVKYIFLFFLLSPQKNHAPLFSSSESSSQKCLFLQKYTKKHHILILCQGGGQFMKIVLMSNYLDGKTKCTRTQRTSAKRTLYTSIYLFIKKTNKTNTQTKHKPTTDRQLASRHLTRDLRINRDENILYKLVLSTEDTHYEITI